MALSDQDLEMASLDKFKKVTAVRITNNKADSPTASMLESMQQTPFV